MSLVPFPATRVAYLRVVEAYAPGRLTAAFDRLAAWAGRALAVPPHFIGMSRDDPDVTPAANCRYDMAVAIPDGVVPEHGIRVRTLPACLLAVLPCRGDVAVLDRAWTYLYRDWLPASRFLPANLPAMELYRGDPAALGWNTFDLDCAVPVVI